MKKTYVKPELDAVCFTLNDVVAASGGESRSPLDWASDQFEKATDGILLKKRQTASLTS